MKVGGTLAQDGFALVETLIATAIVATMAALFFQLVASNARLVQATADRRAAIMIAGSALDAAIGDSAGVVARRGTESRLRWQVTIDPYEPRAGAAPPIDLVTVTVVPTGSDRPILRLRSLRVGQ